MNKKVTILGAGESGVGAALLAKSKGEVVFVSDSGSISDNYKNTLKFYHINFEEGGHNENYILGSDLIIKSPGIPEKAPIIKKLREKQIPVISEIEYGAWYSRAKFIAISGSNGKTTTTLLTYHILKELGLNVGLAGNIGDSLARQVIEDKFDYYVLELSSFQLDDLYRFRADIAVLLNITPDHLDRYEYKFENYIDSKFRIVQNMVSTNSFICSADDPVLNAELSKRNILPDTLKAAIKENKNVNAWVEESKLCFNVQKKSFSIDTANLPLKGKHNQLNIMSAVLVAAKLGLDETKFEQVIFSFINAPHRLEFVGEKEGVKFINDSKATNVDSVFYALDSFSEPIVWIAGGVDKGNDYSAIISLVREKVKAIICIGIDNSKLIGAFGSIVPILEITDNIKSAVEKASAHAVVGDIVLLSPACASFDLFKNYEDRGEQFKEQVGELIAQSSEHKAQS